MVCASFACHPGPSSADASPDAPAPPALRTEPYFVGDVRHDAVAFIPERRDAAPLVLLFDPGGHAETAVTRWIPAARAAGWIVASTPRTYNGTPDESDAREMLSLLRALEVDFKVDRARVYTGGTSGGGCGAYVLAILHPDEFRGGFIQTAHLGSWRDGELAGKVSRRDQRFYLFTRDQDFNRAGTHGLATAMQAAGLEVTLVEHPGGHEGMRSDEIGPAIAWMTRP
jgi:poly(3-hydroxybutyrate) depolymerase